MPKSALALVACLVAVACSGAFAQSIWKWRDAAGQLHMSDTPPPPDVPDSNILQRATGRPAAIVPPVAASGASGVDSELQKKKVQADRDKAAKLAADKAALDQKNAAIRADNCQRAQTQAQALQSGVRVARLDAKGERTFLDDQQRAQELQRAQDIIAQNCGK